MSGPIPKPQWAVVPADAYIGFRIDMQTVGVPAREHGITLLALGGKIWGLKAGKYSLRAAVTFDYEEGGPKNQWLGELELPAVEIIITAQMLADR